MKLTMEQPCSKLSIRHGLSILLYAIVYILLLTEGALQSFPEYLPKLTS